MLEKYNIPREIQLKLAIIQDLFKEKKVLIAFSGGIDSSLICFLSTKFALKTKAITVNAPVTPQQELTQASTIAKQYSFDLEIINFNSLENPQIKNNDIDRCYYCKSEILSILEAKAKEIDFDLVVDGTNFSDLSLTRAGLKALKESKVHSPLAIAQLSKPEIIQLSEIFDLPSKDYSSQACLASRIPFNFPLDPDILRKVEQGEIFLRNIIKNVKEPLRVRIHAIENDKLIARIEVNQIFLEHLQSEEIRDRIVKKFQELGFAYTTYDIAGFTSGSMHKTL
jgi:pyridinium-3,5-biscarboxylic acid mononucleotide sulfurtransferase